jgi:hypothetical protein
MKIVKLAAGDQEFEQGFFQLAYDKLQSKLYNLLPFLVGFQLVKKSQDGTKAVGVFGFKSNNGQILFVPAFFVNGKIKEMDIMYSRNNNQFYPLTEDFAELFLKDDITGIGTPSDEKKEAIQKSMGNPNMRDVIWPPRTGRIAYAELKAIEEKNEDSFEKMSSMLEPKAYSEGPSLLTFVKEGENEIKEALWDLLVKRADFADAVKTFYSDEEIADALRVSKIAKEKPEPKLKIVDFDETDKAKHLPEEHKKKVVRDGFAIVDNRPESAKSQIGMIKFTEEFSNPSKTGFYPYITEMGTIRYGLIIVKPKNLVKGFTTDQCLVIDLQSEEPGRTYEAKVTDVFIKDHIEVADVAKALNVLEEPAEGLPSYEDYILVNENLVATEPFRIIENYKDGSGIRRVKVEPKWYAEAHANSELSDARVNSKKRKENNISVLVLTKRSGNDLEYRNSAVYVPKGFKLLKIKFGTYYYGDNDEEKQRVRMGKPGGLYCLNGLLREHNTFPLTIHTNGSEYFVNINGAKAKFANPIEAKIAMVTEVGLEEKVAEDLLSSLTPNCKKAGYIKLAVTGDSTLRLVDEEPQSNELGQPTYFGIPWVDMHDRSDGYTGDPTQPGLGVKPDEDQIDNTVNKAVDLAQGGQKEVFDTQAISALSRYADTSTKVLEYVPNFVSSLDKLGRMLFLAYWDTDKFEKMYGKDELPELMELIKNVFTNLGDLIIFMKRRVPDISINNNEQEDAD